ncbi:sporulation integral membrane protein YtvI [Hathewaya proteolytica DSM 3090]|uniref:Sporulation integral membrane protein YtvI n=1 Tax=Hathewaya proteolytica DSM 3090 TaxID=1121331 RepID=A0A1M6M953_9CLOT|nr:sporulation integral membrane protein YtvI [Hathewaya proteolytica]SHJ79998.1 sporulation integral membrane protein YtvI [Hathewaya proteolytica DSM 3090]
MNIEKKRAFIIDFVYAVIVIMLVYIGIKYVVPKFMPFIIGLAVAMILKPLINFISRKTGIKRKPVAMIMVLIFYVVIGSILTLISIKLFGSLRVVLGKIPDMYSETIKPAILDLFTALQNKLSSIDPSSAKAVQNIVDNFSEHLGGIISTISSGLLGVLSYTAFLPGIVIGIVFSIISSFFFAVDYEKVTGFILKQLSPKVKDILFSIKNYVVGTVLQFIKAYGKIMSITFVELFIGFTILRIENAFTISLIIALLDIMPVLGTGGVMIPWVLVEIIKRNFPLAFGLGLLYIVITIIRNIIEPKIVGDEVGLHPLIMLICMFLGVKLFGALGLFLMPITVVVIINLNSTGKINLFK